MKKRLFVLILMLSVISSCLIAQQYPPEWAKYTYGGYLYDIENGSNSQNINETQFINNLLNIARSNLAKKIEVSVKDNATLKKIAVNGKTTITYVSVTDFSTDLKNIKLLETDKKYDPATKRGFAVAFIEKEAARRYYRNELNTFFNKISNSLTIAQNYIATGFKYKAKTELESVLSEFGTIDESFFWLAVFDLPETELDPLLARRYALEQSVKQNLADLQHSTSIYLVCSADDSEKPENVRSLQNKLKGELSKKGCNFTDNPTQADWCIRIDLSSREYSKVLVGNQTQYYAYADADISIDKVITSQQICNEHLSKKGGHTFNYKEAIRAAYENLKEPLSALIIKTIDQ